jgi:hypothetical protein
MRTIFTLFLAVAMASALEPAAESYDEHHLLRGPNNDTNEDYKDRDLLFIGSASQSFSFSAVSSSGAEDFCIDYYSSCLEQGYALTGAMTVADTSGNAIAFAESEEYLFLCAYCDSFALSYALTCAFSKVDGDIRVDSKTENYKQVVTLGLNVKAASTTFAKAESVAVAKAVTDIDAQAFTDIAVFCSSVPAYHPFCGGVAGTEIKQIAVANADSFGVASSSAESGALAKTGAFVVTASSKCAYVNGFVSAYVKAWSFAQAQATALAFANSFTASITESFSESCIKQYGTLCANSSSGFCGYGDANIACAAAWAKGSSFAEALAIACAEAFIASFAKATSFVFLTANVDLSSSKPVLGWTQTTAGVANYCNA